MDSSILAYVKADPVNLPSCHLYRGKVDLPAIPCIYFVLNDDDRVIYVGKASNLRTRMSNHQKMADFGKYPDCRVAYLDLSKLLTIDDLEAWYIHRFDPEFNLMAPAKRDFSMLQSLLPEVHSFGRQPNKSLDVRVYNAITREFDSPEFIPFARLIKALGDDISQRPAIVDSLKRLGYEPHRRRVNGKQARVWILPEGTKLIPPGFQTIA